MASLNDLCSLFQLAAIELNKSISNPKVLTNILSPDVFEKYMKTEKTVQSERSTTTVTIVVSTSTKDSRITLDGKIWKKGCCKNTAIERTMVMTDHDVKSLIQILNGNLNIYKRSFK